MCQLQIAIYSCNCYDARSRRCELGCNNYRLTREAIGHPCSRHVNGGGLGNFFANGLHGGGDQPDIFFNGVQVNPGAGGFGGGGIGRGAGTSPFIFSNGMLAQLGTGGGGMNAGRGMTAGIGIGAGGGIGTGRGNTPLEGAGFANMLGMGANAGGQAGLANLLAGQNAHGDNLNQGNLGLPGFLGALAGAEANPINIGNQIFDLNSLFGQLNTAAVPGDPTNGVYAYQGGYDPNWDWESNRSFQFEESRQWHENGGETTSLNPEDPEDRIPVYNFSLGAVDDWDEVRDFKGLPSFVGFWGTTDGIWQQTDPNRVHRVEINTEGEVVPTADQTLSSFRRDDVLWMLGNGPRGLALYRRNG